MSLRDWYSNTRMRVDEDGLSGLTASIHPLYRGSWRIVGSRLPLGTNIYERSWDVLVILDGCRVDVLDTVDDPAASEFDVGRIVSVGSTSREWLAKTFVPKYTELIRRTAYVTANPFTEDILSGGAAGTKSPFNPANWSTVDADEFLLLDEVWKDAWNDELGTVIPRDVTDRAISAARSSHPDRMIIHYMQPHQPFLSEDGELLLPEHVGAYWGAIRRNDLDPTDVVRAYERTLAYVLREVPLLRENLDAERLILTADHGNAFGEWGILGHPNGFLHPSVKVVPWVELTAQDCETYQPTVRREPTASTIDDRLRNLGYVM